MTDFAKFLEIRQAYADVLPEWMDDYAETGNMWNDPYIIDWEFSPIESLVWGDIRDMAIPFYPQVPVLNYFLDFGNPFLKIGIECDGKAWHDKVRDQARDKRLAAAGWMIFRIEGHECVREVDTHAYGCREDRNHVDMDQYFGTTSAGVLRAIKRAYFDETNEVPDFRMGATLFNHRSTPETYPRRQPIMQRRGGPVSIGELLGEYFDLLERRMKRAASSNRV